VIYKGISATGVAVALLASSAFGQAPSRPVTGGGAGYRLRGENFVLARYLASGSASVYGGRRFGDATIVAGLVVNVKTDTRTPILGAGTRIRFSRGADVGLIAAAANTNKGMEARLYALPRFVKRPFSVGATATYIEPIGGRSVRQLSLNPLTVGVRVRAPLQLGVSVVNEWTAGKRARFRAGPIAQVRTRVGAVSWEGLMVAGSRRVDSRISFSASR
jgi:hypothetical protein